LDHHICRKGEFCRTSLACTQASEDHKNCGVRGEFKITVTNQATKGQVKEGSRKKESAGPSAKKSGDGESDTKPLWCFGGTNRRSEVRPSETSGVARSDV